MIITTNGMTSMINDEDIKIIEAIGYHDGYYWDYRIRYYYKGEPFTMMFVGSWSGYMEMHLLISKGFPELLNGWDDTCVGKFDADDDWETVIKDLKLYAGRLKASGEESMELSESNGDCFD